MGLHYMQQHGNYQKKQTNKQTNKQTTKQTTKTFKKKLTRNMNMFNHISKLLETQLLKTVLGDGMASWIALLNCHN